MRDLFTLWAEDDRPKRSDLSHYGHQPGACSHCGREDLWPYSKVGEAYRLRCKWCGNLTTRQSLIFAPDAPTGL